MLTKFCKNSYLHYPNVITVLNYINVNTILQKKAYLNYPNVITIFNYPSVNTIIQNPVKKHMHINWFQNSTKIKNVKVWIFCLFLRLLLRNITIKLH